MLISVISLFPEMFQNVFDYSILKRAKAEKRVEIQYINLREFGIGRHKTVDDRPYGGGAGMILRVDVLHKAIEHTKKDIENEKVILLDPKGKVFNQQTAQSWADTIKHLILICGRYEGFDTRILNYVDEDISIGDYILSGGEIASMVIIETLTRLLPGVLKKEDATRLESFSPFQEEQVLEYPQYTRPGSYEGKSIPSILLSGHQKKIDEYRLKTAKEVTFEKRPDIIVSSSQRSSKHPAQKA